MDQPISGLSNTSGFIIYAKTEDGLILTAQNQAFQDGDININIFKAIAISGLSVLIELLLMTAVFFTGSFLIIKITSFNTTFLTLSLLAFYIFWFLFTILIDPLISSITGQIISPKKCRQWHYCEHIVIELLKTNKELTPDNFKITSPLSLFHGGNEFQTMVNVCKTSLKNIDKLIQLTLFVLLLASIYFKGLSFNTYVVFSLILLIIILWGLFSEYLSNSLSDFLQKLTLAFPEEWQIEKALEVAKKFKKDMYEK